MAIDISSTTRRIVYTGSAGTGPYAFNFEVLAQTDIDVYFNDVVLTLTTDFTVTVDANGTGSVTIVVGTNVPTTPDADDRITIVGARTIESTKDFTTGGHLFATSLNEEFDSLTIFTQQNKEQADRALSAPVTDPTTIDMTLPINTVRANKTLAFDADGNPTIGELIGDYRGDWTTATAFNKRDLVKDTTNDNIYICTVAHTSSGSLPIDTNTDSAKWDLIVDAEAANTAKVAAEAAQAAAETAQTAAELAETNAETAETNAASSASAASTSASNAATSATNASNSATSASTSASNASTSETNAASSASAASTSASNAASSASAASTSASNASTSATAAASSASAASTSATNSANSASAASTSASNAATSATNASNAQTAAEAAQAAAEAAADNFEDTYLGAKASDPTLDNDGDALTTGDLYFNTTTDRMRVYDGATWGDVALDPNAVVSKTAATGSAVLPSGTTAERDVSPAAGYLRWNTTDGSAEIYSGSNWGSVGGGATGGGSDQVFVENDLAVTTDYSITSGKSASSVGPITINSGVTVTVPSGSRWVVL